MKRSVNYLLAGILALLGFSSCTALREAREARAEREKRAFEEQQKALVEQELQRMLEEDARAEGLRDPEKIRLDSARRAELGRTKLLYAVPNVPYRRIESE
ncbi:MAG: hypothetical protein K5910_01900 [Bacteroidales bacterium]|nr:hypothetical protein [Bacteroidales bacterium]